MGSVARKYAKHPKVWWTKEVIAHRPLVNFMTGAGAVPLIRAALQSARALPASAGQARRYLSDFEVESWRAASVHVRPNAGASVTYRVKLTQGAQSLKVSAVASTEVVPHGSTTMLRADPQLIVPGTSETKPQVFNVWVVPSDPYLPGMEWATNAREVGAHLGLEHPRVQTVVYRPTRRAMIRVSEGTTAHAWIKVLRPEAEAGLLQVLDVLEGSDFPYAPMIEAPAPGVVIQRHGEGTALANLISREPYRAARMFPQIKAVLDALPPEVTQLPLRKSWTQRRKHYADELAESMPDLATSVKRLVATIDALIRPTAKAVPTHGDFFEANMLTKDGRISTVLDLDSMGPGTRADDYACLLAHVSVLPFLTPGRWIAAPPTEPWRTRLDQFLPGRRCPDYRESETVLEAWRLFAEREVDAADLYARCAAVTLSLATSASLEYGEAEVRARFARAKWWAQLATENA